MTGEQLELLAQPSPEGEEDASVGGGAPRPSESARREGRPLRVLHLGNIANNSYNNVKFLRRKGVEADVLIHDYTHIMSAPEWEDADFIGTVDQFHPRWDTVDLRGFARPDWFMDTEAKHVGASGQSIAMSGCALPPRAGRPELFEAASALVRRWSVGTGPRASAAKLARQWKGELRGATWVCRVRLGLGDEADLIRRLAREHAGRLGSLDGRLTYAEISTFLGEHIRRLRRMAPSYDILHACGTDPIDVLLAHTAPPYVAFEHGTLRDIPFENTARGRLLALAYHMAGAVVITNPDVRGSAERLGLSNYVFVPHPVDETKYKPQRSEVGEAVRSRLGATLLLFAPARHDWNVKGNDVILKGFAEAVRRGVDACLVAANWGADLAKSTQLAGDLGVASRIEWVEPLHKTDLVRYYNAADVVLDQFVLCTFGTTVPEAMACGVPVISRFDEDVHRWCFEEMPPVVQAESAAEIGDAIAKLCSDRELRQSVGERSRLWVERHHGWDLVSERLLSVYRDVLDGRRPQLPRA